MKDSNNLLSCKTWEQIKQERLQYKKKKPTLYFLEYSIYWPIRRFVVNYLNPKDWYREVKWFVQRGKRGWADIDAWNFFSYNARVVSEALYFLSRKPTGYPQGLSYKRWKARLHATSLLFDAIYRHDGLTNDIAQKALKKACRIMERDYYHWWD